ncbi:response regulator transcription factor [Lysobacter sp. CA196]|uniref:response regulator transcription factor n=1 Tax=Lysobacter sp. CA196 TaxID=3455606 RepID=UPI003F8D365D
MRILIVEDNADLAGNLFDFFQTQGHLMDAAPDGLSALHLIAQQRYDVIVLDWMMPRLDGPGFLRRLRKDALCDTPVLMLTAKDRLDDKLAGFEAGADDYLVKPFALPELVVRMRALVARDRKTVIAERALQFGELRLYPHTHEAVRADKPLKLSPTGRILLELLLRAAPNVVTRRELERALWGEDAPDLDLLRSHMHVLRKAVDGPFEQKLIRTVQRAGYRLDDGTAHARDD